MGEWRPGDLSDGVSYKYPNRATWVAHFFTHWLLVVHACGGARVEVHFQRSKEWWMDKADGEGR